MKRGLGICFSMKRTLYGQAEWG